MEFLDFDFLKVLVWVFIVDDIVNCFVVLVFFNVLIVRKGNDIYKMKLNVL